MSELGDIVGKKDNRGTSSSLSHKVRDMLQIRGEFGRHFGSIFELGKCAVKCSVVW